MKSQWPDHFTARFLVTATRRCQVKVTHLILPWFFHSFWTQLSTRLPGDSEFTNYIGNLSCKNWHQWHCELPFLACTLHQFWRRKPLVCPDYCPCGHGHDNIQMAYSILILQNSLNAIISSKDCTFLLRESLTGSSSVHILLQPYDLLNDLKINNKLIYSALYETCLSIWDITRYKTLKSWPAPRSQLQSAECTKFLGPHVLKTMLY